MRTALIEDNPHVATVITVLLTELGHEVHLLRNGHDALEYFRTEASYDLVVCDFHLGDMTAVDVFAVAAIPMGVGIIVTTGSGELPGVITALRGRAVGLNKPFALHDLAIAIEQAMATVRTSDS